MTKFGADQIIKLYSLYVLGIDKVGWDIQGMNFVHKRKEIDGTCSKHGGRIYRMSQEERT
jgi:hypothetical protein